MKIKIKQRFWREFRKQLRMAISAAAGFIIAYSWKDAVIRLVEKQVQYFTTMTSNINIGFLSSVITTIIGVLIILISSQLLKGSK